MYFLLKMVIFHWYLRLPDGNKGIFLAHKLSDEKTTFFHPKVFGGLVDLHHLQGLLRRGFESLEAGGRLVYSTCSLNPIVPWAFCWTTS